MHQYQHNEMLQDIVMTSDDKFMYCVAQYTVFKWNIETKQELFKIKHPERGNYFLFGVLSRDNTRLMSNGGGAAIALVNCAQEDETKDVKSIKIVKESGWVLFEMAPDSNTLIQTNQYNGQFWIVDLKGDRVVKEESAHSDVIIQLSFTKDGKYLITRSKSETIIWKTTDWSIVIKIQEEFTIITSTSRYCIAFIHDGLYKPWTAKVLKDFSDDFEVEEVKDEQQTTDTA